MSSIPSHMEFIKANFTTSVHDLHSRLPQRPSGRRSHLTLHTSPSRWRRTRRTWSCSAWTWARRRRLMPRLKPLPDACLPGSIARGICRRRWKRLSQLVYAPLAPVSHERVALRASLSMNRARTPRPRSVDSKRPSKSRCGDTVALPARPGSGVQCAHEPSGNSHPVCTPADLR